MGIKRHALDGFPVHCRQVGGRDDELASGEVVEVVDICRDIEVSFSPVIHGQLLAKGRPWREEGHEEKEK